MGSTSENSSSFSNRSHAVDWNDYNWCTDYPTVPRIWSAISGVCFLFGLPGSVWVLYELRQTQRQKSTTDLNRVSLAVINLIFIAHLPFSVCNFLFWHINELHIILCFIYNTSVTGRPLIAACVCWECYVAVVHPIVYKTSKNLILIKKAVTIIICFTIAGFALVLCNIRRLITTPFVAIPLIVALPVITFCDISILGTLRKPDPTGKIQMHPQKKQALDIIFNNFIMTFVVYLPPTVIFSLGSLMSYGDIECYCCLIPYGYCLSTIGCTILPFLYMVIVGKMDILKNCFKK